MSYNKYKFWVMKSFDTTSKTLNCLQQAIYLLVDIPALLTASTLSWHLKIIAIDLYIY